MFDTVDFEANPKKYTLFQTATIATTELPEFVRGEIVGIEFVCEDFDENGTLLPVYAVEKSGNTLHLFGTAFERFVL